MDIHPRTARMRSAAILYASYGLAVAAATAWPLSTATAPAQEAAAVEESGLFLTVPNPITSEVTNRLKESIDRAVGERRVKKLVLDFNPDGLEAGSRDFGPCADLAEYLAQLPQVLKIAFVHNKTTRHTVLPVLACDALVMSAPATLGDVLPDQPGPPTNRVVQTYRDIAGRPREALVLKMLDRGVEVLEGRRNNAAWYLDGRRREE